MSHPPFLTAPALASLPGVAHGFFGRQGGVSDGLYASLNCGPGSNDRPEAVAENRRRCAAALGVAGDRLVTLYQVHSPTVVTVTQPIPLFVERREQAPRADAMVTKVAGIALGVLAADCAPVLFADAESRVIGAAHAGWKGAKGGVLGATVAAMVALGADRARIVAAVGPHIGADSYEVGPEFPQPFLEESENHCDLFRPAARPGHFLFDLGLYIERRLAAAGIANVTRLGEDTLSQPARFFSYRRSTLAKEPDYGRELSAIALK